MCRVSNQRCFLHHSEDVVQTEPKLHGVSLQRNKIFHNFQKGILGWEVFVAGISWMGNLRNTAGY